MKGLTYSQKRGVMQSQEIVKQVIKFSNFPVTVSGASGVGFGAAEFSDFPQGNILFLGAVANLRFTKDATASGVTATFDGDYSIGSAATADATLSGSEVDIIPSTSTGAATADVSPVARGANATQLMLDNTDGSLELNLNVLIDDAAISAANQLLLANGELYIAYIVLGDD